MKIKKLFKKKSFKLSLVFLSLVGMLASGGHSFAKYRDENYGSGNAGAAKFDVGVVSNLSHSFSLANIGSNYGVYALVANFNIDFSNCEVSLEYNISLKLSSSKTAKFDEATVDGYGFTHNSNTLFTLIESDTVTSTKVDSSVASNLTGNKFNSIQKNVAYASNEDGWTNTSVSNDWLTYSSSVISISDKVSAAEDRKEYSVMFFAEIDGAADTIPPSYILYDLQVWQVEN